MCVKCMCSSSQFLQKHVEGTQLPAFPKTPFLSSCQRSCEFVGTGQCLSNVLSVLVEVGLIARNVLDERLWNPRFTERTSTNLGRSHRLPHVCTIMIYGKLGGHRLQETAAFIYIYICDELWIICDIWVSLMWILEKYDDITLKRGIANLGRSHRLPRVFNNVHQFP